MRKAISTRERGRLFLLHGGVCHLCGGKIQATQAWDVSHEIPLALGGEDDDENRKLAHRKCHRAHTAKIDIPAIAKSNRVRAKHIGAKAPSARPLPGGRNSKWRIKMNGQVVPR